MIRIIHTYVLLLLKNETSDPKTFHNVSLYILLIKFAGVGRKIKENLIFEKTLILKIHFLAFIPAKLPI